MPFRDSQGKKESIPSGNDSGSIDGTGELLVWCEGQVHGKASGGRSDTSAGKISLARSMELWAESPDDRIREPGGGCPSLEGRFLESPAFSEDRIRLRSHTFGSSKTPWRRNWRRKSNLESGLQAQNRRVARDVSAPVKRTEIWPQQDAKVPTYKFSLSALLS